MAAGSLEFCGGSTALLQSLCAETAPPAWGLGWEQSPGCAVTEVWGFWGTVRPGCAQGTGAGLAPAAVLWLPCVNSHSSPANPLAPGMWPGWHCPFSRESPRDPFLGSNECSVSISHKESHKEHFFPTFPDSVLAVLVSAPKHNTLKLLNSVHHLLGLRLCHRCGLSCAWVGNGAKNIPLVLCALQCLLSLWKTPSAHWH